jgi:preprotein translocase subunit YajC
MPSSERPQEKTPAKRLKSFRKGQNVMVMGIKSKVTSVEGDWINIAMGERKIEARVHRNSL